MRHAKELRLERTNEEIRFSYRLQLDCKATLQEYDLQRGYVEGSPYIFTSRYFEFVHLILCLSCDLSLKNIAGLVLTAHIFKGSDIPSIQTDGGVERGGMAGIATDVLQPPPLMEWCYQIESDEVDGER